MKPRLYWDADATPAVPSDWVWDAYDDRPRRRVVVAAGQPTIVQVHMRALGWPSGLPASRLRVAVKDVAGAEAEDQVLTQEPVGSIREIWQTVALPLPDALTQAIGVHSLVGKVDQEEQEFLLLVTLGAPAAPWRPDGHIHRPWLSAVEVAARTAHGCTEGWMVLDRLQDALWKGEFYKGARGPETRLKIVYDVEGADEGRLLYLLDAILIAGGGLVDRRLAWGCADCASAVALLAGVLGVAARVGRLVPTGGEFFVPTVRAIGGAGVQSPLADHYVVIHHGRVWDPTFRFKPNVPVKNMDPEEYRVRLAGASVRWETLDSDPPWSLSPRRAFEGAPGPMRPPDGLSAHLAASGIRVTERRVRHGVRIELTTADDREGACVEILPRRDARGSKTGQVVRSNNQFDVVAHLVGAHVAGGVPRFDVAALAERIVSVLPAHP